MTGKSIAFLSDADWPNDCFDFELPFEVDRSALVVIDMQNYCISPESDLARSLKRQNPMLFEQYSDRVSKVIENIERLLEAFRSRSRPVIFTRHGSLLPDGSDLIPRRRSRESVSRGASSGESGHMAAAGDEGHAIISRLKSGPNELVLDKNTGSAFNSTGIDFHLRNMGVTTLVVTGIATDMCVMLTSLDAADRGWNVFIASDACTTIDTGSHAAALLNFSRVFGGVLPTREILGLLDNSTI